ncbi:prophage tail fiber N-terminal domain-containing protein [Escherichia coli]|uniref:prophage tail fiber N-terminal domain-containing protein n=1 Tax=Escherichia coli TaxID=562 RepID=UPI000BDE8C34|nr:prophage tail fiber N-terminal domain-containing protein [Escherichia coli]EET1747838.1 phage tail protein [Escherichia coli]EEU3620376.1 phage tail protein [Escherichia coli]EEV0087158.1 phage tail protein [Escherichia coli]EEV1854285.1 phage tail protein [Escherichia coli]EEW2627075.1 phage tail protein [Escherichia coli]
MAVKISGVLKDGAGKPVQNCTIQLKAKRNSTTVVVNTVASENPDEAGRYSMDVEYGQYGVILLVEGFPPSHAGTITVDEGSRPGTLNDFLTAPDEGDLKPDVVKRFEDLTSQAQRSADVAISATKRAEALLSEMQGIAGSFPGLRFENFDDIVSRCTTAMLQLEQPEVVNTSISLKIKENIDFNYVGAVNGYCDISEPEKYKVEMYAYTTGEYFNGDANLNSDGTFYFRRCWTGAKQFRLIRIEDNAWITTLEFPLLIRSYWIPEDADPEVTRVMKDRCYTYDQALAALALMVQRHDAVERYISGLCALVDENGGVKFFVNRLSAMSSRAYYRLGNAAWVYYALAFYLEKYPDGAQVNIVREKLLSGIVWLDSFLVTDPGDLREGLYKGGLGRYVNGEFDASFVAEWCALEHNVDIWFLFELMGRLGFDGFSERADRLAKSIIRGLWVEDEGRFRQGVHPTHYDNAAALDQSSWGGLFVANIDAEKAAKCRKYMGRFLFGTRETTGYTPYHPDYGYSGHSRGVWVEGTAGVALFERKLGNELNAVNLIAAMAPLRDEYGYRDSSDDPTYDVLPPWPSTTNTAWIILAVQPDNFWLVDEPEMDVGKIRY